MKELFAILLSDTNTLYQHNMFRYTYKEHYTVDVHYVDVQTDL